MTDLWGLGLRGTMVLRILAGPATSLDLTLQLGDSVFVLCFHLVVLLLKRVDLAADQFNLLNMTSDLPLVVDAALRFGLEFSSDAVEQVVQTLAGPALGPAHDAGRVAVIHGHGMDAFGQDDGLLGRSGEEWW